MAANTCCYGCTERHLKCHMDCEKYKEYKLQLEKEKGEKRTIRRRNSRYFEV